jgi:thiol-disulfide isomerase/thioredoxin
MPLARRDILALGAVAAVAGIAGAVVATSGLRSASGAQALLAYTFVDLDGRAIRLKDWSAPLLLCNFWATWCAPCREEIPLLIAARRQFAGNGLQIAGIGIDDASKLQSFVKAFGIDYPVFAATWQATDLLRLLGDNAAALPYSVILDRERRIAYRKLGAWSKAELEREIQAAFG